MRAWRRAHPEATLTKIERALDHRLNAALLADAPDAEAPCPPCGGRLARRGERPRALRTAGDAPLELTRPY